MTSQTVDEPTPLELLKEHLSADPANRAALLQDPQRMGAIAADIAPADASLRTALRAVVESGAGRMLLGEDHPGPEVTASLIERIEQHGVSTQAAQRCVGLLETALFGYAVSGTRVDRRDTRRQEDRGSTGGTSGPEEGGKRRSRVPAVIGGALVAVLGISGIGVALNQPVPAPTGLTADTSAEPGVVRLHWDDVADADDYETCQDGTDCTTSVASAVSFEPGDTDRHSYSVVARKGDRESEPATVSAAAEPPPVPAPTGLSADTTTTPGSVILSWDAVAAADHYEACMEDDCQSVAATTATFDPPDNEKRTYSVSAVAADGRTSEPASITASRPVGRPSTAYSALVNRLNPALIAAEGCQQSRIDAATVAAKCALEQSQADSPPSLWVYSFGDRATMDSDLFGRVLGDEPSDDLCPGATTNTWIHNSAPDTTLGNVACFTSSDGAMYVVWTYWESLDTVIAGGAGGSLEDRFAWWKQFESQVFVS